jgi:hypothetical protein
MRDRDEIADTAAEPSLRSRIAELEAENAKLRAALAAKAGAPSPGSSPPAPAPNTPPAGNVVPLKTAKVSPTLDDITSSYPAPAEPWRAFSGGGGRLDPWSDNRE